MKVVSCPAEVRSLSVAAKRQGLRVGFVPTMGFLHEGHLSLIRVARQACDMVVVSIFVNPAQFGPTEDFDRYPRDIDRDRRLCAAESVDVLFCPDAEDMYGPGHSVFVEETRLSKVLCGVSRPTHFRGVTTVVAKFFSIVQPDVAVFGQKDAQQARVIQQLVRDLDFPVEIAIAPIVREPDGLAMSSRNRWLSPEERAWAPRIFESLRQAQASWEAGTTDAETLRNGILTMLHQGPGVEVGYVEIVDWEGLKAIERVDRKTLVAVAVRAGNTRLIDNVLLG